MKFLAGTIIYQCAFCSGKSCDICREDDGTSYWCSPIIYIYMTHMTVTTGLQWYLNLIVTAFVIPFVTGFQLSIQKTCGRSCASACPEVPSAAFGSLAGPLAGPSVMHYKNKHPNRFLKNGELDVPSQLTKYRHGKSIIGRLFPRGTLAFPYLCEFTWG